MTMAHQTLLRRQAVELCPVVCSRSSVMHVTRRGGLPLLPLRRGRGVRCFRRPPHRVDRRGARLLRLGGLYWARAACVFATSKTRTSAKRYETIAPRERGRRRSARNLLAVLPNRLTCVARTRPDISLTPQIAPTSDKAGQHAAETWLNLVEACPNSDESLQLRSKPPKHRPILCRTHGQSMSGRSTEGGFGAIRAALPMGGTRGPLCGRLLRRVTLAQHLVVACLQRLAHGVASADCCHRRRSWRRRAEAPFEVSFGFSFSALASGRDGWSERAGLVLTCEGRFVAEYHVLSPAVVLFHALRRAAKTDPNLAETLRPWSHTPRFDRPRPNVGRHCPNT